MTEKGFDPIELAETLRPKMIDLENKKVLLATLSGTAQEQDLDPRRFWNSIFRAKLYTKPGEDNYFRGEPAGVAAAKLTNKKDDVWVSPRECNRVFLGQINGCNLKCWYCYVDDVAKSGNPAYGKYVSAYKYLIQFLIESRKSQNCIQPDSKLNILRISGGEVFIVPEIIFWMIETLEKFELQDYIYIWVDCNLCTGNFYWKYLTEEQRIKIRQYKNIGFCGCYKGIDPENFFENTGAHPDFFYKQFEMHKALINEGLDVYSYLYPVTSLERALDIRIMGFMDLLQHVDHFAPLRMATPIIKPFSPTRDRLNHKRDSSLEIQHKAIKLWEDELKKRFGEDAKRAPHEIPCVTK